MKLPHNIIIIIAGFVVLSVPIIFFYPTVTNPTPSTTNIPASADVTALEIPSTQKTTIVAPNTDVLSVGYNATTEKPLTSFIRFDLSRVRHADAFNTVTYDAKLVLLGGSVFPKNVSVDTDYIVTATPIRCDNLNWSESGMKTFTCLNYDIDNSTTSSIMIRGNSIPNFYEWPVTSAVDKALKDKQVTFRMAGYGLTSPNFNGGVEFWSKETASYLGSYAGPTELLIVTSETTPSQLSNMLVTIGSIVAIAGIAWSLTKKVWKRQ